MVNFSPRTFRITLNAEVAEGRIDLDAICDFNIGNLHCNCSTFARDLKCWHLLAAAANNNIALPPGWPNQQRLQRLDRAGRPVGARAGPARPQQNQNQHQQRGLVVEDDVGPTPY
jgi:hypothetical protein